MRGHHFPRPLVPRPHCDAYSAFKGDSYVEWFEGNYADYEEDRKRRLGADAEVPKRIKYKQFSR